MKNKMSEKIKLKRFGKGGKNCHQLSYLHKTLKWNMEINACIKIQLLSRSFSRSEKY